LEPEGIIEINFMFFIQKKEKTKFPYPQAALEKARKRKKSGK
jgi:hypothetical protein